MESEGKTFADLLKNVKTKVNSEEIGDTLSIRKGAKEEVVIRIQGDDTKRESAQKVLQDKLADVKISKKGRPEKKVQIVIKDLDLETSEQEVLAAIEKVSGEKIGNTPRLRPAYGKYETGYRYGSREVSEP